MSEGKKSTDIAREIETCKQVQVELAGLREPVRKLSYNVDRTTRERLTRMVEKEVHRERKREVVLINEYAALLAKEVEESE